MFIAETELFRGLGDQSLSIIGRSGGEKVYRSNAVVFRQNSKAEHFYVLIEGMLHLVMGEEEELCFTVDKPGEIFGWSALVEPFHYLATARTMADSRAIAISREIIERVVREYPPDGVTIFRNLAAIVTGKLRDVYHQQNIEIEMTPLPDELFKMTA
jgi:CRP/FNR family transcriptional regulator, cyclic AMP receptor protein